ncbi:MAG: AI-2E family transporter [Flavisolibacter sp.]
MKPFVLPFYVRLGFILIILIALGYLAILGKEILSPLLFSFLFAILLLPLANFLEKKLHWPRGAAAIVSVLLFLAVTSTIIYIIGVQVSGLASEWPLLKAQVANLFHNLQLWIQKTFRVNVNRQGLYINNITQDAMNSSAGLIGKTVFSLSAILLLLVFVLIYTCFLLIYRGLLMRFIVTAFTERYIDIIYDITAQIRFIIRKYITGLFFEMAIITAIAFGIFFMLGIKYVFLLALLVGVLNLIPYVGIFTALAISACITFATYDGQHALYVVITVIGIHLFDSNFLMPKIVGSQVKLNPLIVILGVVVGEMLWGIPGMFLAIPYLAIAKVIFDRVPNLQAWGILLGEEEHTPRKVKRMIRKVKTKEKE